MQSELKLSTRISLAFQFFFRALRDEEFAARVADFDPALPPALPASETTLLSAGTDPRESLAKIERERGALMLLGILQQQGRLIDFVEQDVDGHSDTELASAARVVHAGCRKALRARTQITALKPEAEGSNMTVAAGYNPQIFKLTGNVSGAGPYEGRLQHPGWRAAGLDLPMPSPEHDAGILAPAEIEL